MGPMLPPVRPAPLMWSEQNLSAILWLVNMLSSTIRAFELKPMRHLKRLRSLPWNMSILLGLTQSLPVRMSMPPANVLAVA